MNLTPKQEAFCLAYLETGSQKAAYRQSRNGAENMSDAAVDVEASRMMKVPKVALRIAELRAEVAERVKLTTERILEELEEARSLAQTISQPSAMVAASMGRAKVAGLIIERSEQGKPGDFENMNAGQLRENIAREIEALGLNGREAETRRGNGKARGELN